jgi:hypothetical protein
MLQEIKRVKIVACLFVQLRIEEIVQPEACTFVAISSFKTRATEAIFVMETVECREGENRV